MAVQQIVDFMENGNIKNSVNYPTVDFGRVETGARICISHKASVKAQDIAAGLKEAGADIKGITGKEKGDYAYTMIDIAEYSNGIEKSIECEGILKIRTIIK